MDHGATGRAVRPLLGGGRLAYVKAVSEGPRRAGFFWGSVALFACALLSKSIAVTLPATLLVLDVYPLRRLGGAAGWRRWHVWAEKLPFLVSGGRRRDVWPSWRCCPWGMRAPSPR